ncbi:TolB family protein [Armatimonas rosea]|uniref:Uncharacterized protein n=1 Tax=Armatimonas rosea TaxID=685828 RepID=A0A7W9SKR8_ARMRO|nr:PD40 domain-containing protein [Armatimonas rosea]MBB6048432.1 hypothetical protein [Armatimonas rosea]
MPQRRAAAYRDTSTPSQNGKWLLYEERIVNGEGRHPTRWLLVRGDSSEKLHFLKSPEDVTLCYHVASTNQRIDVAKYITGNKERYKVRIEEVLLKTKRMISLAATCILGGGLLVPAMAQVPPPSDPVRDIGRMLNEWSIAFLGPDPRGGSRNYVIRSMRSDGTAAVDLFGTRISLTNEGYTGIDYALTPDGNTVVYSAFDGTYVQTAGRARTRIMPTLISNINVSPDGRKLVYTRTAASFDMDIYVCNIDGTGERQLTSGGTLSETKPCWSPDGRKILYSQSNLSSVFTKLMIMEADGSGKHAITEDSFTVHDRINFSSGKWSPDGSKIVAIGYTTIGTMASYQIYTLNADGTSPRQLTTEALLHANPCWSPDGRKILYVKQMGGASTAKTDIFLMDADGTHQINLTNTPSISEESPKWKAPIVPLGRLVR